MSCDTHVPVSAHPSASECYPSSAYAWLVVAVLFSVSVVSYTDRYVLTLLVDPISHDLEVDDFQISLLLGSSFALVYAVIGIVMGVLADRLNRRNLIVAGILLWSCATIGCGFARAYDSLFLMRMCVGIGEATLAPASISLVSCST